MASSVKAPPMSWTAQHDLLLLRETLLINPFNSKKGSPERGKYWKTIADNLNSIADAKFTVDQRNVREHLGLLEKRYKRKMADELSKGTGTSPEPSEFDLAMEQIIQMQEASQLEYETENEAKKDKIESDRLKAEDIRKRAMEKLGDTQKRKAEEGSEDSKPKRNRRSGSDTIEYLKSKSENDLLVKKQELEIKKQQQLIEIQRTKVLLAQQTQMQSLQQRMEQQQEYQQQQLQNMQAVMLQNQQQQNQALMTLFREGDEAIIMT